MKLEDFRQKQSDIEKKITALGTNPYPIVDGVFDPTRYLNSNPKILWVLQEAYDRNGNKWAMKELIDRFVKEKGFGKTWATWEMVLYVSWSILHPNDNNTLKRWHDMEDHEKRPEMINTLYDIAFINVKKLPNVIDSRSRSWEIAEAYERNRLILLDQIETYSPDIIIFGHTMRYFYHDLKIIENMIDTKKPNTYFYRRQDQLLIDVYHPAYRKSRKLRENYCNEILEIVESNCFIK